MSNVLLFGRNGQLGGQLISELSQRFEIASMSTADVDLGDSGQLRDSIQTHRPALILNAAAYTAVDKAEDDRDNAYAVNATAPAIIAEEALKLGAGVIHFSTDFVFEGSKTSPYVESDTASPLNVYGASKLAGEQEILNTDASALIFRTSWLYGPSGNNFLLTMRRLLSERDELSVVNDQTGTPTSVLELAHLVARLLPTKVTELGDFCREYAGLYHLSCEGQGTWFEFASAIRDRLADGGTKVAELRGIPSSGYPTPAERPRYSVLDKSKFKTDIQS